MIRFLILFATGFLCNNAILSAKITQAPPEIQVLNLQQVSCFGLSDGAITVAVSNGDAPYTFLWSNGSIEQNQSGLAAGAYSLTVTDATAQTAVLTGIQIVQPAPLSITLDSIRQITCLNNSGYIKVSGNGGTAGYDYFWNDGSTTAVRDNLGVGAYALTVTDVNGCTAVNSYTITANTTAPNANAGPDQNLACTNAVITLNGSGSSGPQFSYLWLAANGGNIQSGATTLNPVINHTGVFTLAVTNTINGCITFDIVVINGANQPPVATANGGTLTCNQQMVTLNTMLNNPNVILTGWIGPNGYMSTANTPIVTVPGTYTVSLLDTVTTCTSKATAIVYQNIVAPTATAGGGGTITCAQPFVTLTGAGTPANITYSWTGPNGFASTQQSPAVALAGLYTLVTTNPENGCTASSTRTVSANTTAPTVSISNPATLTCVITQTTLNSNASPANVTYAWTGPSSFTSAVSNPTVTLAGVYTLMVTNPANGCKSTATVTVNSNTTPPGVSAVGGTITCASTSTTIAASSGTNGVTYQWKGPSNYMSSIANPSVSVLGAYTVTVTNPGNGCTSSTTVIVNANTTQPTLTVTGATINCNQPTPKILATSNTNGATFSWSGPFGYTATGANPTVSVSGAYLVTVTSPVNGCTRTGNTYVYEDLMAPGVYAGDDRSLNCYFTSIVMTPLVTPAGNNFSFLWTTQDGNIVSGATTPNARVDAPGAYLLTVKNNQNGCSTSDQLEVYQPLPVSANATVTNQVSCNGGANGSATVSGGGGNLIYSYTWSTGAHTASIQNLAAGVYSVTVLDGEGCSSTAAVTITQPSVLQANATANPQTIQGVNNGSAMASGSGGTPGYTYKWSNGPVTFAISGLAPGAYTVTITDSKGCTAVATTNVNAVSCAITGSITASNISCFGAANGTATLNLSGAANPISYNWTNGNTTKTISNLGPGTYTVTATDGNGCTTVFATTITSPAVLATSVTSLNNVVCQGNTNGAISLGVVGGTSPYTYAWNNGGNAIMNSNLAVGAYTCTVTDSKGCTKTQTAQITLTDNNPPQLFLKNATVAINANGLAALTPALFDNGSSDLECSIASWSVAPTSFNCSQVGTHIVTLTATDINGNAATGTATVTIKDESVPFLVCPENRTVSACASVVSFDLPIVLDNCITGGIATLSQGLPSGSTFPTGVTTDVYSFTDGSGNVGVCSLTITVLPPMALAPNVTNISCPGLCNGSAQVTVSGGQAPYNYLWSSGQSGNSINNLCPDAYSVTVTDGTGCTQTSILTVQNASSNPITVNAVVNPAGCSGSCDGSAYLNISGGTFPVTIGWSNGQSGQTATNLCPGSYGVLLTDAVGCTVTQTVQVNILDTQSPVLVCPNNVVTGFCNPVVNFQAPQVFDNCVVNTGAVELVSGLNSGSVFPEGVSTQTFRYVDGGGNAGECTFFITVHPKADINLSTTDVACANTCTGSATLNISNGQAPYNIAWSNSMTGNTISNLCTGTYTATITDADGCQQFRTSNVSTPSALILFINQIGQDIGNTSAGFIDITVIGGVGPYTYTWIKNGQLFATTEDLNNLSAGQYLVTVTDANGCFILGNTMTIVSTVATDEPTASMDWQVFPNPVSGSEITLRIQTNQPSGDYHLEILDLSGRLLQEQMIELRGQELIPISIENLPEAMLVFRISGEKYISTKMVLKN